VFDISVEDFPRNKKLSISITNADTWDLLLKQVLTADT
jgi:hypothetical protein